ncbi:MAG: deoxyribonuclease IV [Acidimicrobiia bacterium]|nr:deoxyribonuclease IV [Acidimicrobiia bacterium]MDX2467863.1 deoxyribonuclease IV [Acidimicrobiia bacterium]
MLIGAHVGSKDPLGEAKERNADVVQIFIANPQSWKKPVPRDDAEELKASGLPIYVHAPYIMNPVSPNNRIRIPSRKTMAQIAEAAEAIGAKGLIVHGGHVGDDEDIAVGFERWRKALESFESPVPVLIENTAGGGHAVARELDNYGPLWEEIGGFNVGVCLDTCHAWAAGEDLATVVDRLVAVTGKIDLVHCNDSRDPHNSRRDRHTNLGKGEIPEELIVGVVKAADAPVVVETPSDDDGQKLDIAWLRERI